MSSYIISCSVRLPTLRARLRPPCPWGWRCSDALRRMAPIQLWMRPGKDPGELEGASWFMMHKKQRVLWAWGMYIPTLHIFQDGFKGLRILKSCPPSISQQWHARLLPALCGSPSMLEPNSAWWSSQGGLAQHQATESSNRPHFSRFCGMCPILGHRHCAATSPRSMFWR